ncbi:16121_t:CDS:2, partial [Racocetra persica]
MEKIKNKNPLEETLVCTRCSYLKPLVEFILEDAKKRKKQDVDNFTNEEESTIDFANITDYVYDILLEYKNINDDFEGATKFQVKFNINFELICEALIDATEQDRNLHISNSIVNAVSNGDGYTYVYQSKYNSKKQDYISFTYWCNAQEELHKYHKKVEDASKRH